MSTVENLVANYRSRMCQRRIRVRYGENGANDVRAGLAFLGPARFGEAASAAHGRGNQLCAEFWSTTTAKQPVPNLEKGSPHRKTVLAEVTAQMKGVGLLA